MSQIIIKNLYNRTLIIDSNYPNLLKGLQAHSVDWMHACGGKGRCTTCKAIIIAGMDNLTSLSGAELGYIKKGLLQENERLICQIQIKGDLIVAIPKENKFPHMDYSD